METIKVKQLSKFGVQLESGEYVNWSKKIKDSDKGLIVPGGTFSVDMYRAESGKGYINAVETGTQPVLVAPVFAKTPVVKPLAATPKADKAEVMTKADWSAKDRSMMVGGLSHDAAVLVAASVTANVSLSEVLEHYTTALKALVVIREEVK